MKHINNIFDKIKSKKGGAEGLVILTVITFGFLASLCYITLSKQNSDWKNNISKADSIVSNYAAIMENDGYLSDTNKANLSYSLKELGFSEVDIIATEEKDENNKNITLTVTVEDKNLHGGTISSHNFIRAINLKNKD